MGAREEVGELANQLRYGLYAHTAILQIARDPRAIALTPMLPDQCVARLSEGGQVPPEDVRGPMIARTA